MFYEVLEIGKNTLIEIPKPRVTGSSPAYRSKGPFIKGLFCCAGVRV